MVNAVSVAVEKTSRLEQELKTSLLRNENLEKQLSELQRDDGVIVYLDGAEVGRDNIGPNQQERFRLLARDAADETSMREVPLTGRLEPGITGDRNRICGR